MRPRTFDFQDWRLCDCAGCGAVLVGDTMPLGIEDRAPPPVRGRVAGRVYDRPYCGTCLPAARQIAARTEAQGAAS